MARAALSQEELAGLYRRRFKMVYQICLVLMKNVPDAEDAAQTVFRKALERAEPFRDPEHEKAWLIVTARNECKNQLKHWWRTRRAGEEALESLAAAQAPASGALSSLLSGLCHRRDRGHAGGESLHCALPSGPGPEETETQAGGGRLWTGVN